MNILEVLLSIVGWLVAAMWMFSMVMADCEAREKIKELQDRLDALEDKE